MGASRYECYVEAAKSALLKHDSFANRLKSAVQIEKPVLGGLPTAPIQAPGDQKSPDAGRSQQKPLPQRSTEQSHVNHQLRQRMKGNYRDDPASTTLSPPANPPVSRQYRQIPAQNQAYRRGYRRDNRRRDGPRNFRAGRGRRGADRFISQRHNWGDEDYEQWSENDGSSFYNEQNNQNNAD